MPRSAVKGSRRWSSFIDPFELPSAAAVFPADWRDDDRTYRARARARGGRERRTLKEEPVNSRRLRWNHKGFAEKKSHTVASRRFLNASLHRSPVRTLITAVAMSFLLPFDSFLNSFFSRIVSERSRASSVYGRSAYAICTSGAVVDS